MIEVLINYVPEKKCFGVYEPSSDTIMYSGNLGEALVSLSKFLQDSGMISTDILNSDDISYHIDSATMKGIVESNVNLMKRLNTAPSGFMISSQKFGSSVTQNNKKDNNSGEQNNNKFGDKKRKNFSNSGYSGNSGFKSSFKKFGGYG